MSQPNFRQVQMTSFELRTARNAVAQAFSDEMLARSRKPEIERNVKLPLRLVRVDTITMEQDLSQ
jgi:hypothetical protein